MGSEQLELILGSSTDAVALGTRTVSSVNSMVHCDRVIPKEIKLDADDVPKQQTYLVFESMVRELPLVNLSIPSSGEQSPEGHGIPTLKAQPEGRTNIGVSSRVIPFLDFEVEKTGLPCLLQA